MRTVMKVLCFGDDCFLHNKIWNIFLYSGSILNKSACYIYVVVFVITIVDVYDYINYQKFKIRKKNEHARYTVEYFLVNNVRVIYTKGLNS
jgi:hypothetical protein